MSFFTNPDPVLGSVARLFAAEGNARAVAVLTFSTPQIVQTDHDNWDGGITSYTLYLHVALG